MFTANKSPHFTDDKSDSHNDEDLMYEYNNEDYEGDDYDFSQVEKTKTYQPPQVICNKD